jgi:DNA-binding MarR family transcriptional regulator
MHKAPIDLEAARYQRPSIRKRALDTLSRGPASERTLAALLDCELHAVSTCIKSLRADGLIRRLGPTRQKGSVFVRSDFAFANTG